MNLDRFPYGAPDLEILPGDNKYPFRVKKDFVYCWPGDNDFRAETIVCPKDYCTDLLSIPKVLWPILSPFQAGCWGSLPHDILCSTEWGYPDESIGRRVKRDNRILRQAMLDSGASGWRVWAVYQGVELGCAATWKDHIASEVTDDLILMEQAKARWERTDRPI